MWIYNIYFVCILLFFIINLLRLIQIEICLFLFPIIFLLLIFFHIFFSLLIFSLIFMEKAFFIFVWIDIILLYLFALGIVFDRWSCVFNPVFIFTIFLYYWVYPFHVVFFVDDYDLVVGKSIHFDIFVVYFCKINVFRAGIFGYIYRSYARSICIFLHIFKFTLITRFPRTHLSNPNLIFIHRFQRRINF